MPTAFGKLYIFPAETYESALSREGISCFSATTTYTISDLQLKATPEPATATLSLPALAGLASRRRRHEGDTRQHLFSALALHRAGAVCFDK